MIDEKYVQEQLKKLREGDGTQPWSEETKISWAKKMQAPWGPRTTKAPTEKKPK